MCSALRVNFAKLLKARAARCLCAPRARSCADDARKVVLDEQRSAGPSSLLRVRLPCSVAISSAVDGVVTATLMGVRSFQGGESPITLSLDSAAQLSVNGVDGARPDLLCRVRVPCMTNIDVELSGCAQAELENLVLDQCRVRTEGEGDITLSNVKANAVVVTVEDGSVTVKGAIHGNLEVASHGSGGFNAQRILANDLKVETLAGQQHMSAVYAEKACLNSTEGAIHIGTLHSQDAALRSQSGAITLGGLDGEQCMVTTGSGDVSVVVTDSQHLSVATDSGNVTLSLSAPCRVTADAPVMKSDFDGLPEDIYSSTEPHIRVKSCSGSLTVKKQDWISSLNLGGGPT